MTTAVFSADVAATTRPPVATIYGVNGSTASRFCASLICFAEMKISAGLCRLLTHSAHCRYTLVPAHIHGQNRSRCPRQECIHLLENIYGRARRNAHRRTTSRLVYILPKYRLRQHRSTAENNKSRHWGSSRRCGRTSYRVGKLALEQTSLHLKRQRIRPIVLAR